MAWEIRYSAWTVPNCDPASAAGYVRLVENQPCTFGHALGNNCLDGYGRRASGYGNKNQELTAEERGLGWRRG